jgi:hypothetical protein
MIPSPRRKLGPACFLGALTAFLLIGCSSSNRAVVKGSVTLDGEPVDGGMILFFPANEQYKADQGRAEIKNGSYEIAAGKGPPPGNYRVEITWQKKTGKQVVSKGDPPNMEDETIQVIPPQYNQKSQLTKEIKAGDNKLDFPLTSK